MRLNILFIGESGAGKSTTANLLYGQPYFKAESNINSVTKNVSSVEYTPSDKFKRKFKNNIDSVQLIDTPGLFDTERSNEEIVTTLTGVSTYAPEGIHAVILMIDGTNRFTENSKAAIDVLKTYFNYDIFN